MAIPWAVLLLAAFALRIWQFGNPVIHIDEQFYLLVGDRLWHGTGLPYVDAWDRKPFGLFLIYAATRIFGGDGVLAYQIVATVAAGLTAGIVQRLATRIAPGRGALFAGLAYIVYLSVNGGDGGQSPVFYNLPVALAALAVVRVYERPRFDRTAMAFASAEMTSFGIALQIKYSVLFEGVFFGVALLVRAWRCRVHVAPLAAMAATWCMLALLPTAAVVGSYWMIGQLDALVFANFQSVFLRQPPDRALMIERLTLIALHLLPLVAAAIWALPAIRQRRPIGPLLLGWAAMAIVGLLLFGTYFDHYALPLVLPLAVIAAPTFARTVRGVPMIVPIVTIGLVYVGINTSVLRGTRGDGEGARRFAARIGPSPRGCLFVFSGDPILYQLTGSCLPTAYNFPTFLSEMGDSRTLRIDPHAELRMVMARRPGYVVISSIDPGATDIAAHAFMRRELARHYRLIDRSVLSERVDQLYQAKGR
ncbi:hypothetical protein M9979_12370 [Sphingomonas sp. RP10(2022)]|uniref:Glycosyltransferase RgtA/B/C/D-like domain-containing protein n=1 Tax=Sphingomonas liriopis TaxID=2949094 RepID=A0A9X2HR60_9SPHN|nr:hypothetical protein [Sphingomonas liriopis]MCP3735668.1 hypothetical protein [Sphingomonas liriopis]